MIKEKGLGIDSKKLIQRAFAIAPDRDRYFNDIIRKFRESFPGLKLLYANNRMGAQINPEHPQPDFLFIAKGKLVSKDPRLPSKNIVIVDAPLVFTDRSIAGWTIAVENGNMKGYFSYMLDKALRIDEDKFYEYIVYMARLSLDKDNPLYWKSVENEDKLVSELGELYARYNKRGPNRIGDARGYTDTKNQSE